MFRPSLRLSSFFTARASSTANSTIGRFAAVKIVGLLFNVRSAASAWSCASNSTNPMPRLRGFPFASGRVLSNRSLACRTFGFAFVARCSTASWKIFFSCFWSTSGGTFRTCNRFFDMKKFGFFSFIFCSSFARRRFMMSSRETPCAAGPSSCICPSVARYRLRLSRGPSRRFFASVANAFDFAVAKSAASVALTASAMFNRLPATLTPPPSTFPAASIARDADAASTKSTNAVPFERPVVLSRTTRHDRTFPNFCIRSKSDCFEASVGRSRTNTLAPAGGGVFAPFPGSGGG